MIFNDGRSEETTGIFCLLLNLSAGSLHTIEHVRHVQRLARCLLQDLDEAFVHRTQLISID
jgi:hypothetical protein